MSTAFAWPEQIECAVSLTYDDGLPIHTALVGPTLQECGLRATFYPPTLSDLRHHPDHWRRLAAAGHELGNHTVFHPCRRTTADQHSWLEECYNLCGYSAARLRSELAVANLVLSLIDGQTERTYGNTCCDTTIGSGAAEQAMDAVLADLFVAARGALTNRSARPADSLNLLNVGCISADGLNLAELIDIMDDARAQGGWAVLMIHGVGSETHDLHLDREVHRHFIAWLAGQPAIWTAPFIQIAKYIKQRSDPQS
jgi:peptidoglycan/xylan/chitin deacetylase (PgdA/CDA1 family)